MGIATLLAVPLLLCTVVFLGSAFPAAAQDTIPQPFLKSGRPLDQNDLPGNERSAYVVALRAHPNHAACTLSEGALRKERLDMESFRSLADLEVCLFWAAAEFQDLGRLRGYLDASGLRVGPDIPQPERLMMMRYGVKGEGMIVGGSMSYPDVPKTMVSILDRLIPPYGLSASITLSSDLRPLDVQVLFNRK